jgi:hypothetical protein
MPSLRLVDGNGDIIYEMNKMDVTCLSSELFYTIDYRPEEWPEYEALREALDRWLSAQSG